MSNDTVHAADIEATLKAALSPEALVVTDDSASHAGHAGSDGAVEGTHFSLHIKARCFAGMGPVARHRLVYDALRDLIPRGIHALAIKAEPA
jgi:BolA protein